MITPTKGIAPQRALLTVAAQISLVLDEPMTVSQIWTGLKIWRVKYRNNDVLPFAWFVLALDVLFALDTIRLDGGLVHKLVRS